MAYRWYVVHVYSGFERKVAQSIREQAQQKGMAEQIQEVFVPTEEVVELRRGAKVNAERKFFPGYVLIKMEVTDETWHLVKNTPKVTGFLGGKGRPTPISDAEAARILTQVKEGIERPKPAVIFEVGEQVRVSDGRSPPSTAWSRKSTRRRAGSRWRCRSSAAPRRWSWSTGRWRRPEPGVIPAGAMRSIAESRDPLRDLDGRHCVMSLRYVPAPRNGSRLSLARARSAGMTLRSPANRLTRTVDILIHRLKGRVQFSPENLHVSGVRPREALRSPAG
jgi:transcriptional antiterminator NusG